MNARPDAAEQRKLRSVARRYEREGYRVTTPGRGGHLPAFLDGFSPDLIAEREGDRVVIEVKRSDAVRGSNDLTEIAARVSREPGWRFELVALPPAVEFRPADYMRIRTDVVEEHAREAIADGYVGMACMTAVGLLEALLWDLAAQHGLKPAKAPFAQTERALVSLGIVPREVSDALERSRGLRDALVRGQAARNGPPTIRDVEDLLALARRLQQEAERTAA